jgi:hypothetical protein
MAELIMRLFFMGIVSDQKTMRRTLGIDTMLLDNDDAKCRHGVRPTCKRVKGFQLLQMNWGRLIIGVVFRDGDKYSNHGYAVEQMIRHAAALFRKKYRRDFLIIIRV